MHTLEEISKITAKGQTTVPKSVRQALGVGPGGRIAFRIEGNSVTLHAIPADDVQDPALAPFLALLAADLVTRPTAAIHPLPQSEISRLEIVAQEVGVLDLDEPIEGDLRL